MCAAHHSLSSSDDLWSSAQDCVELNLCFPRDFMAFTGITVFNHRVEVWNVGTSSNGNGTASIPNSMKVCKLLGAVSCMRS